MLFAQPKKDASCSPVLLKNPSKMIQHEINMNNIERGKTHFKPGSTKHLDNTTLCKNLRRPVMNFQKTLNKAGNLRNGPSTCRKWMSKVFSGGLGFTI